MMKSWYASIYPLRKKSDIIGAFKRYFYDIKVECNGNVKVLCSDKGVEYRRAETDHFFKQNIIKREFKVPRNP